MAAGKYRKWFEASNPGHPLTPEKLSILYLVSSYQMLTCRQVASLTGKSEKASRGHLRDLQDMGLTAPVGVPRAAVARTDEPNDYRLLYGAAPKVHRATREGIALLVEAGMAAKGEMVPPKDWGPRNWLFLSHELEVRDVRSWLEEQRRAHGHVGVKFWKTGPEVWMADARPDAMFAYADGKGGVMVRMLECDRGTEKSPRRWQEKVAQYASAFRSGAARRVTGYERSRVLVTTPGPDRTGRILATIDGAADENGIARSLFMVTQLNDMLASQLTSEIWRAPGTEELHPLVPVSRM